MLSPRSANARLQSDFYRDQYRKVLNWLVVSVVIMLLLTSGIIYLILFQPIQKYYANTVEGRILSMPTPSSGSLT
jgi:hypothetical protein